MKKFLFLTLMLGCLFTVFNASAQMKGKRPSPPDTVKGTIKGTAIEVAYSQPSIKGRTVGKEIAPWGKVWRTGANEETTISFSKDVTLEGKALPAGKYSLWTIPGETEWVIIINKKTGEWGTKYDEASDVFRVTVKTLKTDAAVEQLKFAVKKDNVAFAWGNYAVAFKIK